MPRSMFTDWSTQATPSYTYMHIYLINKLKLSKHSGNYFLAIWRSILKLWTLLVKCPWVSYDSRETLISFKFDLKKNPRQYNGKRDFNEQTHLQISLLELHSREQPLSYSRISQHFMEP
jgi:hypothetical protein